MNKTQLTQIIKEEIRRILKEGQEPITFSGNKSFMDIKAINVLIKNGIDKASIKRAYDPDEGVVELTAMIDDATAAKIGKELEALDKRQGNYGGYLTADELDEAGINMTNQGYGTDYYGIKSDVMEKWDELATIKSDLKGYISSAHDTGGPKLAKDVMNAILAAVKESQPLLSTTRGSSKPYDVDLASKQPQNELFGFGATKLKEGDKISMTVEPKAGFGAKGQIDKYEMEVIQVAVGGVKVDFVERPETHTLVPEQGWLKSAEGKVGERELKVGDFSRKQFGGTIKSIAVNGKETKGIKW